MPNWNKIESKCDGRGHRNVNYISLNPNTTNARVPVNYQQNNGKFKFNCYIDSDNNDNFAIEICENGDRVHTKGGFASRTITRALGITRKTRYAIVVDDKGWLICTKLST